MMEQVKRYQCKCGAMVTHERKAEAICPMCDTSITREFYVNIEDSGKVNKIKVSHKTFLNVKKAMVNK